MNLPELTRTYCNPLPLPNYPRGTFAHQGMRDQAALLWDDPTKPDYREAADPSVLYHEGKWYLYPSCDMAWVSADFVTWEHCPLNLRNIGYAPTIVRHGEKFLLTASDEEARLYVADDPLGPFTLLGQVTDGAGLRVSPAWLDPMLFSDDDGALYAYWGLGPVTDGIYGVALDRENPTRMLGRPVKLFGYDPAHEWERVGEDHQFDASWVEGPWMVKIGGRYFLTYAAPGTEYRNYAMGCYAGDYPLGPFHYQGRNPILQTNAGMVTGTGHGCIVAGPGDTYWAFYTCLARTVHRFERRIGMDPAGVDAAGNLFVAGASSVPQWAPGVSRQPVQGNAAGLVPVTRSQCVRASSTALGRDPIYAIDHCHHTYWQASEDDAAPWIQVILSFPLDVAAARIWWREPQLNYEAGCLPGPYRYRIEGRTTEGAPWQVLFDATDNAVERQIDYRVWPAVRVQEVRLVVTGIPPGLGVGLVDFTVFGQPERRLPV